VGDVSKSNGKDVHSEKGIIVDILVKNQPQEARREAERPFRRQLSSSW
jgi:hypothetical protein